MVSFNLLDVRDVASHWNKNYSDCCDYCLTPGPIEWPTAHCYRCHETFLDADEDIFSLHRHKGGCRFPGNLDRFYEQEFYQGLRIWFRKPDPDQKESDG